MHSIGRYIQSPSAQTASRYISSFTVSLLKYRLPTLSVFSYEFYNSPFVIKNRRSHPLDYRSIILHLSRKLHLHSPFCSLGRCSHQINACSVRQNLKTSQRTSLSHMEDICTSIRKRNIIFILKFLCTCSLDKYSIFFLPVVKLREMRSMAHDRTCFAKFQPRIKLYVYDKLRFWFKNFLYTIGKPPLNCLFPRHHFHQS